MKLMLAGTETLLTYETKMTFTNKPKNLKFYWDSNKTQEAVVENETYLALNGFITLEDNKKRDIPIYWAWPLETGSSPSEIEENDEIDTTFIGKTMSMKITTAGAQVTSNPYANRVASTTINGEITTYNTVQAAINAAGNNQGAVVTLLDDIQESVVISANQDIVLNMNEKTISSGKYSTVRVEDGTLTIVGNGSIKGEGNSTNDIIAIDVRPNGVLNILGNAIITGLNQGSGTGRGINNYGTTNIKGGNISGKIYGITNQSSGKVNIYYNTVISIVCNTVSTTQNAVITIYGGTIQSLYNAGNGQIIDYR